MRFFELKFRDISLFLFKKVSIDNDNSVKRGKHQKQVEYSRKVQHQNSKQLVLTKVKQPDASSNNIADDGTPAENFQPTKRQMVII